MISARYLYLIIRELYRPNCLSENSQQIRSGYSEHCYSRCLVAFVHVSLQNEDIHEFMVCNKWMMFHEKVYIISYIIIIHLTLLLATSTIMRLCKREMGHYASTARKRAL